MKTAIKAIVVVAASTIVGAGVAQGATKISGSTVSINTAVERAKNDDTRWETGGKDMKLKVLSELLANNGKARGVIKRDLDFWPDPEKISQKMNMANTTKQSKWGSSVEGNVYYTYIELYSNSTSPSHNVLYSKAFK